MSKSEPELQCGTRRKLTRMFPSIPGLWATYSHRNCTCNEFIAMRNRVLGRVPEPTRKGLSMLRAEARRIGRQLPSTPTMSVSSFVNHYSGKRRTRYEQAAKDLKARPLTLPRDAEISAFVKSEKFNPGGKVNPDPRMIQARNARYNIAVGVYLKPIEHELYRMKSERTGLPFLRRACARGGVER